MSRRTPPSSRRRSRIVARAGRFAVDQLECRRLLSDTLTPVPIGMFSTTDYRSNNLNPFQISTNDVQAGGTISVSYTSVDALAIACSNALRTDVTIDGVAATATGGTVGLYSYDFPRPAPDDGAVVAAPAGSHTVTFRIDPAAVTEGITADTAVVFGGPRTYYVGPWITGSVGGGHYSSAQPFQIEGTAHTLSFAQGPSDVAVGNPIAPPVTVAVQTNGVTDATDTSAVTLTLTGGAGGAATLGGTTTVRAVAGVATFGNLTVGQAGTYTLTATDGSLTSPSSNPFAVSAGKLVFTNAPADGTAGAPLKPAVTVALKDAAGRVVAADSTSVVTLAPIGFTGDAPITGNTATLVNGVATFNQVALSKPGFYQLQATDGGDAAATSGKFKVAGDHLAFVRQPANADANTPVPLTVELLDARNKVVTDATTTVALTLDTVSGGGTAAVLGGTTTLAFVGGRAVFTPKAGPTVNAAGTYTLTATEEDTSTGALAPTNTTTPLASRKFGIAGLHLVIAKQPANADVLTAIPLTIKLVDSKGKLDTAENAAGVQLSFNAITGGTGATLGGTTTATFHNGVATFPAAAAPTLNGVGTYTLTAVETGAADPATQVDTKQFKVLGYKLKLVSEFHDPFIAGNPDVTIGTGVSTAVEQVYAVFNQKGKAVTSIAGLSSAQLSATAVSGDGQLVGGNSGKPDEATAFYSRADTHDGSDAYSTTSGTNQANYRFRFTLSSVGTYKVMVAPATPAAGSGTAAGSFAPFTYTVRVVNPTVRYSSVLGGPDQVANKPVSFEASLAKRPSQSFYDIGNNVFTNQSVGYAISLLSSSSGGTLSGTQIARPTEQQVTGISVDGVSENSYVLVAQLSVSFSKAGIYTLTETELMTPGGLAFDPANASPVPTTSPVTFTYRVNPDKIAFVQQPPARVAVGQPFIVAVAVEDEQGNVLTDQNATADTALQATLTAASSRGGNPLSGLAPVTFNNGLATFDSLTINTPGVYRLTVSAAIALTAGGTPDTGLVGKSIIFQVK